MAPRIEAFDGGIDLIHLTPPLEGFADFIGVWLHAGPPAFLVDVGPAATAAELLAALSARGIARLDYLLLTHIHLDHAGGAGLLLRHLPNALLIVHPRGARHMVDPSRLVAGAAAVYGEEEMRATYGEILGVDEDRVIEAGDGSSVSLNGRHFLFLDTPGHARHHNCIWDEKSRAMFAGDTFGISYRELDAGDEEFIFPTSSPSQFDPAAAHASLDRIMSYRPQRVFVTHYSELRHPQRLAGDMHELLDAYVALAQHCAGTGAERHRCLVGGLESLLLERLARHGCPLPREQALAVMAMDIELNAQGLGIWMDHERR